MTLTLVIGNKTHSSWSMRPYLFGAFTAADAMFAPVVCRLSAYAVEVSPEARAYMSAIEALPSWQEWKTAARAESWIIEQFET